jgi:endonuclease-3
VKTAAATQAIIEALAHQHPDADTALRYRNAFELLVATMLSAQATDAGVNKVTPALFARFPDARALAAAAAADVEALIHSTGFFRQKARSLMGMSQALVERHGGEVPATMDALVRLPGVGRKTANVVLGHALGVPGLPVDRHVLRVSNRLGIADSDDPERVEQQLTGALPPASWTRASDTLILHGRRVCKPEPICSQCGAADACAFFIEASRVPARAVPARGARPAAGTGARRTAAPRKTRAAAAGKKAAKSGRR